MRASLLVRLVCYAIVALSITPANAAQPVTCAPDKYFQPFDSSETPYSEPSEEFSAYLKKAHRGDPVAQYNLGLSYDHGYLVTRCLEKAKFWYRKAAIGGNTDAQGRLKFLNCVEEVFPDRGERAVIFSVNLCEDRPPSTVVNEPATNTTLAGSNTYECRSRINLGQIYLSYGLPCPTGQAVVDNSLGAVMGRGVAALLNIKQRAGNAAAPAIR